MKLIIFAIILSLGACAQQPVDYMAVGFAQDHTAEVKHRKVDYLRCLRSITRVTRKSRGAGGAVKLRRGEWWFNC